MAFRFCVTYFTMYVLFTQMFNGLVVLPVGGIPPPGLFMRPLVRWVTAHVFHLQPLVLFTGSGDKTSDWVQAFCLLVIAAVVTIVWSVFDRRRSDYARLHRWFRVFFRFALGSTMLGYGMSKAIPLQMPAPSLMRLLEPFGSFSPMGVLWSSIGARRVPTRCSPDARSWRAEFSCSCRGSRRSARSYALPIPSRSSR